MKKAGLIIVISVGLTTMAGVGIWGEDADEPNTITAWPHESVIEFVDSNTITVLDDFGKVYYPPIYECPVHGGIGSYWGDLSDAWTFHDSNDKQHTFCSKCINTFIIKTLKEAGIQELEAKDGKEMPSKS